MPDTGSRALDLLALALDNRAHAAATVALGEHAPPREVNAYVLGYKSAVRGESEPELWSPAERDCCRRGYERGIEERQERRVLLANGMYVVGAP